MKTNNSRPDLASGQLLARNTIWNLLGQLLPMVVAVVTIPLLIHGLGVARFGVLSIAWVVIGYFSLLDLGLGRALTKLVADKIGAMQQDGIAPAAWTSLFLLLVLGIVVALFTCAISPWLVERVFKVTPILQAETLHGFYLLAFSIPMVTTTSGLRGTLEALQRFRILNLIRTPMSIFSFAGPLLVLPFSHSLVPVFGVLVGGRLIGCVAHLWACFQVLPALRQTCVVDRSLMAPLFRLGSWMTISNILGPAILSLDRFIIGAVLSVSEVGYYAAPLEMATRLMIVPGAIAGVLFPAFAMTMAQDQHRTELLLRRGLKYVFLLMFPIVLVIVTFAPEILRSWLGAIFARNSSAVLRWVTAGIFINSLTCIPFSLLQGIGRADITGKVLLVELPIYGALAWMLITSFGIEGAALAWAGRATLEMLVCVFLALHFLPMGRAFWVRFAIPMSAATAALATGGLLQGIAFKCCFVACTLLLFGIATWFLALNAGEKVFLTFWRAISGRADAATTNIGNGQDSYVWSQESK